MSEFAFDVTLEDFETKVLQPAESVPVVVDFWAPWCEPCKVLKPLLEKLAEEYKGRFLLAKVDSDQFPELAQHFGVRSIPSVKVLFQGQLVDEFEGTLPEGQIREFLERFALPAGPGGDLRAEAAALVSELEGQIAATRAIAAERIGKSGHRPRVYFEEWDEPNITAVRWVSEMIEIAGGENIFTERAASLLARDRILADPLEVVRRDPEIIIGSWCGKHFRPERISARPGWSTVTAVQSGRMHEIKSAIILTPGPVAISEGLPLLLDIFDL